MVRTAIKEIVVFLKNGWFLVALLVLALTVYPFERSEFMVWCSLSYVASFVFYTLTLYLPERRNKKTSTGSWCLISKPSSTTRRACFIPSWRRPGTSRTSGHLKETDVLEIFKTINPQDKSTRLDFLGFVNWFQYLEHQKGRIKRTVDRILTYEHYLDTQFILLIESMNNSTFFEILDFIENKPMHYTDFAFLADAYYQCYLLAERLEKYLRDYAADS